MAKQVLKVLTVMLVLTLGFSSCNKLQTDGEVYADSYIYAIYNKAKVPVFNVMHSVYGFRSISSVSVTTPGGSKQLDNYNGEGYSFYSKIDTAAFTTSVPAAQTYTYNITYKSGELATLTDATTSLSLYPAEIIDVIVSATNLTLTWKPVAGVEAYKINVYAEDQGIATGKLIYASDFLHPSDATSNLSMLFPIATYQPYFTTKLTFEVSAFSFEQNVDQYDAISTARISKYFGS